MTTVAVLASGPSLTDDHAESIYLLRKSGFISAVIAISDVGLIKAPWADALVSHDSGWWIANCAKTNLFKGRKFSARGYRETESYDVRKVGFGSGMNSGLMGMFIARDIFKAKKIILLGFDMHRRNGQHFFGPHTAIYNGKTLLNTNEKRFTIHIKQFDKFNGCDVINCTPGSDLKRFPIMGFNEWISSEL